MAVKIPVFKFDIGKIVYLKSNQDMCGMVTGFVIRLGCVPQYLITWGDDCQEMFHWEIELTDEKTYLDTKEE